MGSAKIPEKIAERRNDPAMFDLSEPISGYTNDPKAELLAEIERLRRENQDLKAKDHNKRIATLLAHIQRQMVSIAKLRNERDSLRRALRSAKETVAEMGARAHRKQRSPKRRKRK